MWLLQQIINENYPHATTYLHGDDLYITVGKSRFMTNYEGVYPLNRPARRSKFIKKIWQAREDANWQTLVLDNWTRWAEEEEDDD